MDGSTAPDKVLELPELPPGAPTLARLLHGVLAGEVGAAAKAVEALKALPRVEVTRAWIDNREHWRHESESWVPADAVHVKLKLEDELVSKVAAAAQHLSASLARFKALSMAEGNALVEALAQEHGVTTRAGKGNLSFFSYDRRYKVEIARTDRITFGPEIHVARELLERWVSEQQGAAELKVLINSAFGLDRQGVVRAAEIFRLTSFDMPGDTWRKAMEAIKGSIRTAGKAEYIRVYRRVARGRYELIPLDLASV